MGVRVLFTDQEQPKTHRFTRDEFHGMADAGLFHTRHVELFEGGILEMSPQKHPHAVATGLIVRHLARAFPDDAYWIRVRQPLRLGKRSEPEPCVAVVPGTPRDHRDHPASALLIVEVSDATLSFDRTQRAHLYARARIPDYWILDLAHRQLELRRTLNPSSDGSWSYAHIRILAPADTISPLAVPNAPIRVADLLP